MSISVMPQSVKLLLARGKADTDVNGLAEVIIVVPGTFGDSKARTIEGGMAFFENYEAGDYVTIDLVDDDNLLGLGAGTILDSFNDANLPAACRGWFFMGPGPLELHPIVNNDPTELPAAMYLHLKGQKANIATADTLYINLHWGKRIR